MDDTRARIRYGKILHAPANVAGIAGLLAEAQRDLGYDSTAVEYVSHPFSYGIDRSLNIQIKDNKLKRGMIMGQFALGAALRYDVFHLYFGSTLFPHPNPDLSLLRALRKRVFFHYCGCDIRDRDVTLANYGLSGCTECTSLICRRMHHLDPSLADGVFVSTPDLLEFAPGAYLLPGPIDLRRWTPNPPRPLHFSADESVRILHAPSDRDIKGTKYIIAAVDRLKAAGYPVELILLEGVPHNDVVEFCGKADIAVDQLMIGAYGTVSIEMMAKGVPVLCRIREDLRSHYPENLPIMSADPGNIFDVLEGLLQRPDTWGDIGRRGVEYVRQEHEMHQVARRALSLYSDHATKQGLRINWMGGAL